MTTNPTTTPTPVDEQVVGCCFTDVWLKDVERRSQWTLKCRCCGERVTYDRTGPWEFTINGLDPKAYRLAQAESGA